MNADRTTGVLTDPGPNPDPEPNPDPAPNTDALTAVAADTLASGTVDTGAEPEAIPAEPEGNQETPKPELAVQAIQPHQAPEEKTDPEEKPYARNLSLQPLEGKLVLCFPPEGDGEWAEIWHHFQLQLRSGERFWQPQTPVELKAGDRLLDQRQFQQLDDSLKEVQLQLKRVHTQRRQTAIAAATLGYAVEQEGGVQPLSFGLEATPPSPLAATLYLETTIRSGTEIRHAGSVVILGDLNPGGAVIADGDILIWGRLRGIAHAGAGGNSRCRIMALQMEATQLRIADQVARTPKPPAQFYPEVAYITPEGIRLARASEFGKILTPIAES